MPRLTRRQFAWLSVAAGFAATAALAQTVQPAIIAEGGAADDRIEDTHGALDLAVARGCDFLQVNLVPTKEGSLVARRSSELSASTDVSAHPEFADRKTSKTVDGEAIEGWFAEDFTLAELQTLFCREAQPALRPQNVHLNGKEPILTLPQVLQQARDGCVKTGRTIGVCLRLMHVGYFQDQGLDVVERLASELSTEGYVAPAAAIWVQASEPEALRTFGKLSRVRRMLMIEAGAPDAQQLTTMDGLAAIKGYAEAIGPAIDLLIDPAAATFPAPTTLALDAHHAGLQVFAFTARPQNAFLPPLLRQGDKRSRSFPAERGDVDKLLIGLFSDNVDGVATVLPDDAVEARKAVMDAMRRAKPRNG